LDRALDNLANFGADFAPDGRGEQEQADRNEL
jgi:hypothetical protein